MCRPGWDSLLMDMAALVSHRATCPRLMNGAVITRNDQVLTTGYNGAPRGRPHCVEVGCQVEGGHCVRAVHAEHNAILQAARIGVSLEGTTLYTIYRPCVRCALAIVQVGIVRVWYELGYDSDEMADDVIADLEASGVEVRKLR